MIGDWNRTDDSDGQQVVGIECITIHPEYRFQNDDIALLRLNRSIQWSLTSNGFGSVNRVCLPSSDEDYFVGEEVTVSGWGSMESGLQAVNLSIMPCYKGQTIICAGNSDGSKDACEGDSGGPLIRMLEGQAHLVGIVSNGPPCSIAMPPGFYTNVSSYINWIREEIRDNKAIGCVRGH